MLSFALRPDNHFLATFVRILTAALAFVMVWSSGSNPSASFLRSSWDRSFQALSNALMMYREKHPDEFATIVIDEPTTCFPRALSMPETQSKLARIIVDDLAWLGVHHGCDQQTARVIYASSSAAVGSLSMSLIV